MRNEVKLNREDLYRIVWDKPTVKVAAELGISDVMVTKCRRMDEPKPPPGYWQKLKAGAAIKPAALPKLRETTKEFVYVSRISKEDAVMVSDDVQSLVDKEFLPENKVEIAENFENAHPLILKAKKYLDENEFSASDLIELPRTVV